MDKKIILFDGVCNLCNSTVQFIIKRDKKDLFRFASLQSEAARQVAVKHKIKLDKMNSIVLMDGEKYYTKSTAVLRILKDLPGYRGMSLFLIFPRFFRDFLYDFIAKNRYKWYGKREECMMPTPDIQEKFL